MFKTTENEIKLNDCAGRGSLCPRTPHDDDDEKLNASLSVAPPPSVEALADPPAPSCCENPFLVSAELQQECGESGSDVLGSPLYLC